ncbi:hypothetical protein GO621_04525 [Mucilaginibacter sp. HMF7410]|uniref:Viral A-type inclusion protein n=2 Tax=Mucilaginibacter arboris TaxID=2682090 RepID=A0A7K1STZ4_9SPHI|nr:hypothetical protein [Mucilaginibacter arboris]
MKNKLIFAALLLVFAACKDIKKEEKALESQVMDLHEKVMADGETAMKNKMKMDTLILKKDSIKKAFPALDTSAENKTMRSLSSQIVKADNAMSDWMHNYNPDFTGKPHQEIMQYLEQQKKQVGQINVEYNSVIQLSNQYLLKYKKK